MVTRSIDIVVRERGARAAARDISTVGRASAISAKGVIGLTAALAGLTVGAAALGGVARGSIQASAQIEGFSVRLRALLGSQEGANRALETFIDLSSETPFAVNQIVEGASTLASVTGDNRDQLEELTQITANLAAVTGLSFAEAAGNLQRSLSAGIGAADLFRDRGIRRLIEDVAGVADATKLGPDQLLEAFRQLAGEQGRFAGSAVALSRTLTGALSNIGDAAFNFQSALGDALSPTVIAVARTIIIPFFQDLRTSIKDNTEELATFVADGVGSLLDGFEAALRGGAEVASLFEQIGISSRTLVLIFRTIAAGFRLFVSSVITGFRAINTGVLATVASVKTLGNVLGLVTDQEATDALVKFGEAQTNLIQSSNDTNAAMDTLVESLKAAAVEFDTTAPDAFSASLEGLADNATGAGDQIRAAAAEVLRLRREQQAATDEGDSPTGGVGGGPDAALIAGQQRGLQELLGIQRDLRLEALETLDPRLKELELIDEQIGRVAALQLAQGDRVIQEQVINDLIQRRNELIAGESAGAALAEGVAASVTEGLRLAAETGGRSFADTFGNLLEGATTDALGRSLETIQEGLEGLLSGIGDRLGTAFGGGGGGGGLGSFLGGALGVGASLGLSALSGGLGGSSSSSRGQLAQSAVTSTQAARGVVAGQTSIGIGQVSLQLEEATEPLLDESKTQTTLLAEILSAIRGGGGGSATGAEQSLNTSTGGLA